MLDFNPFSKEDHLDHPAAKGGPEIAFGDGQLDGGPVQIEAVMHGRGASVAFFNHETDEYTVFALEAESREMARSVVDLVDFSNLSTANLLALGFEVAPE